MSLLHNHIPSAQQRHLVKVTQASDCGSLVKKMSHPPYLVGVSLCPFHLLLYSGSVDVPVMIAVVLSVLVVAVRMCALSLVCDSPWGVREELSCSLHQLMSFMQHQSPSGVTADDMELLLCCATFHSVLLQRQKYKCLSKGRSCSW